MSMKFSGVMPALVTPLTEKEEINVPVLKKLVDWEIKEGADGFYIGGATGEGLLLRPDVRKVLFDESFKAAGDKAKVAHITDINFETTLELARYAEKAGADAISAVPPIYFSYDEDDIYNYYKRIAESVHIPLMIYYTPAAGVNLSIGLLKRLFEIDNLTAVKWTANDYFAMLRLKTEVPDANIINGPDEMLLCGLAMGADGGMGTTYNIQLPTIRAVYDNFKAGNIDAAREAQKKADKVVPVFFKYKVIPAVKAILEAKGFEVGNAANPQKVFTEQIKKDLFADLEAAGYEL